MEPSLKADNLVTLPSGKSFERNIFSEYTDEELKDIISQCSNIAHILLTLKLNRIYHYKIKDFIDKHKLSTGHFKLVQKNQYHYTPSNGKTIRSHTNFKASLLRDGKLINKCAICKIEPFWNNKPLSLHLDHINGDHHNNDLTNLRLLCPNCHSQTDTYTGRNSKLKIPKRRPCSECKTNRITEKNNNGICVPCRKNNINSSKDNINTVINNNTNEEDEYYETEDNDSFDTIFKEINDNANNLIIIMNNIKPLPSIIEKKQTPLTSLNCLSCKKDISNQSKTGHCTECAHTNSRKVERPSHETLIKDINDLGYVKTGKKYNVSDNAIRKWVKNYENLPTKS